MTFFQYFLCAISPFCIDAMSVSSSRHRTEPTQLFSTSGKKKTTKKIRNSSLNIQCLYGPFTSPPQCWISEIALCISSSIHPQSYLNYLLHGVIYSVVSCFKFFSSRSISSSDTSWRSAIYQFNDTPSVTFNWQNLKYIIYFKDYRLITWFTTLKKKMLRFHRKESSMETRVESGVNSIMAVVVAVYLRTKLLAVCHAKVTISNH